MSRRKDPNVSDHAAALRRAMVMGDVSPTDLATAVGVSKRTISNWTSRTAPTMPSDTDLLRLDRIFPGYSADRGQVEAVIAQAEELSTWRRTELIAHYQRLLQDQAREDAAVG